jgi:hypothetical protein
MKRKQTRVEPTTHVTDPDFKYQRGADVQATWRRFGWIPPSEGKPTPVFVEKTFEWEPVRRVK